MKYLLNNIFIFWPWLQFNIDLCILQIFILIALFFFFTTTNTYYVLLYFFTLILLFGLFLCLQQADFFTGFLWVVEFTVIFISILLLFYLNMVGTTEYYKNNFFFFFYIYLFIFFLLLLLPQETTTPETTYGVFFNFIVYYNNFYEALNNTNINDFVTLFVGYYTINSFVVLIFGFFLLIVSIICIFIFNKQQFLKINNNSKLLLKIVTIKDFIYFRILRRQKLILQPTKQAALRVIFRK